ncbi:winged helix-turn-helix domain-containing protein [Streptomyces sp. HNM0645]|uniref:winged helix-turn-helix domain-containing protein n=1 Tax=Streptomyces sp. HNM0645 TaxID=2782343 RepID=UPI0024B7FDBC|nr:winged helix-turn-helix domain-containing protein [Streptomyces sp. HNM0645]MDI9887194.1 winged helix-turn-helix domain-containing protein [Streptomyces sp. HNM0645]
MGSKETGEGADLVQRVADTLRAELTDGSTYHVGGRYPTQRELADRLGVSRDTVQKALREITHEGWIESRRGSGTKVIKTQLVHTSTARRHSGPGAAALGPFIEAAFEEEEVALDVFTLTAQSLTSHLGVASQRVQSGEISPRCITVRLLLPDLRQPSLYPRNVADPNDPRPLERLRAISRRYTDLLVDTLLDLQQESRPGDGSAGTVPEVDVQVAQVPHYPTGKLYLLNGEEALHGFYDLVDRDVRLEDGQEIRITDVIGLGATLFHYAKDEDAASEGSRFVSASQRMFNSYWERSRPAR